MSLFELLFGRRLANEEYIERKIGAFEGVPAMGLDGLGSSSYGPEAAMTVLMPLGAIATAYIGLVMLPILALLPPDDPRISEQRGRLCRFEAEPGHQFRAGGSRRANDRLRAQCGGRHLRWHWSAHVCGSVPSSIYVGIMPAHPTLGHHLEPARHRGRGPCVGASYLSLHGKLYPDPRDRRT